MSHELPPQKAKGMVHFALADVAKGCAGEQWEQLARNNSFFHANPDRDRFVRVHWPKYIKVARAILAGMLGDPKRSETEKAAIHEALMKDAVVNPKTMAQPAKPSFFLK